MTDSKKKGEGKAGTKAKKKLKLNKATLKDLSASERDLKVVGGAPKWSSGMCDVLVPG